MRALGRELGLSAGMISRMARSGMPTDDNESQGMAGGYIRRRRPPGEVESNVVDLYATEVGAEQLEDTIPRLRRLEKATAIALEKALKENNVVAAVALRREHCTALRTLDGAEEKLIRINVSRDKLIKVDAALSMIDSALKESVLLLRRLPELGRDPAEKQRLEAFLAAILEAMRAGAARVGKNGN
jgi:hypothetical protein